MPAFFTGHFWDLANAEFWVGAGLLGFFIILVLAKVPQAIAGRLDGAALKIQSELDEAARLREEAEAKRMEVEARARLEESLTRREAMAERKIAQAEAQAAAEVKAAAVELAAAAAERILAERLAASSTDPLADQAIAQIGPRLN